MSRLTPLAVCLLIATSLHAHEMGGTSITLNVAADQTYRVDIETDAASLLEKLENAAGMEAVPTAVAAMQERLRNLDQVFRRHVSLSLYQNKVEDTLVPEIRYAVHPPTDPQQPARANIQLSGSVPSSARSLIWAYAWTFTPYAFTVKRADNPGRTSWLEGGQSSEPITLTQPDRGPGRMRIAWRYARLGFTHIVPGGLDHVLFVLGICLLNRRLRPVLWQVSAFTAAHSITLGLGMYGIVPIAPPFVEPLIAASIVYVAVENLLVSELTGRRLAIVFAFGLLHGLGFAGVLGGLGLPSSEFVTALAAFNVGVEAGQLAVIAAAFLLIIWRCRGRSWYRSRVVVPASLGIASVSVYWTIERLAPLWS
jgi:hydrogenase/urease accessory protein HupE